MSYTMLMLKFCMLSFRQMLTSQSWLDGRKSELVLQEHDDCFDVFEDFLRSAEFSFGQDQSVLEICLPKISEQKKLGLLSISM